HFERFKHFLETFAIIGEPAQLFGNDYTSNHPRRHACLLRHGVDDILVFVQTVTNRRVLFTLIPGTDRYLSTARELLDATYGSWPSVDTGSHHFRLRLLLEEMITRDATASHIEPVVLHRHKHP